MKQRKDGVRRFLDLAKAQARSVLTLPEAAARLGVGVRQLYRMSMRGLGYPPGIVLDLFRIESVAGELTGTALSLATIARGHLFCDLSAMSRQFRRFVGVPPGSYRAGWISGMAAGAILGPSHLRVGE